MTPYVVERWLARLSASACADQFVIKGGMLLAAYGAPALRLTSMHSPSPSPTTKPQSCHG
jgi:hypothetical protein